MGIIFKQRYKTMGGKESKPEAPPPPDLSEGLINMSMKSKMFNRQAGKALKEKTQYYTKAKGMLKSGNEEGARMYLELAQQKENEHKQMLQMAVRLETLAVKIKASNNSVGMVDHLNDITPILEMQGEDLPIEKMYNKLDKFNQAYDDLSIKGHILDDGMEKSLGEKGGTKNVDHMMNGLKAEVGMEMGVTFETDPTAMQQQQQNQANANYYDDLRNMK